MRTFVQNRLALGNLREYPLFRNLMLFNNLTLATRHLM